MDISPQPHDHVTHIGHVQGPQHSGSGAIYYTVNLQSGEKIKIDVQQFKKRYFDSLLRAPDLNTIDTPFGSLPMAQLYVMPYVAPAVWLTPGAPAITENTEPAVEAILRFNRCVIFGAPGLGKTTFLKYLLHQIASEHVTGSFPIFVSLYDYAITTDHNDLLGFAIHKHFSHLYPGKELEAVQRLLTQWQIEGKLHFLLDGLDEVPMDRQEQILRQVRSLPRFVLTTRPRGRVEANQEPGATLDLLPLDNPSVARFVRNWEAWKAAQPTGNPFSAAELFSYIRREPRIADLVRVPQLLSIICWLWGEGGEHRYGTKGELLGQAIDRFIAKAVDLSGIEEACRPIRRRNLRRCLSDTALTMLLEHETFGITIMLDELLEIFEATEAEAAGELLALARRTGLLISTTGHGDELRFAHLVFQEYLAAEALIRHPDFDTLIDQIKNRADFEECLRMACGLLSERKFRRYQTRLNLLIRKLLAPANADIFHLNRRLAALCLSEVKQPERRLDAELEKLETGLLIAASAWWARDRFVEAMGRLRTRGMRQKLLAALQDEDGYVRWAAAEALSQMGDPGTLAALMACLEKESWPPVQGSLAKALGRIGDPTAIPALQHLLTREKSTPNPFVLEGIGEALGRLEATGVLLTLLPLAESNEEAFWTVAAIIISAVTYLSEESAAALQRDLNERGYNVRFTPADPYARTTPNIQALDTALASHDPEIRREAVLALGQLPGEEPVYALMEALLDEDDAVVEAAGASLRAMDDEGQVLLYVISIVLAMLFDKESLDNRVSAASLLNRLWSLPAERENLGTKRDEIREILASTAEEADVQQLVESDNALLRSSGIWLLGILGNPRHGALLSEALEDPADWVRWAAAWALRYLDTPEAKPAILSCLEEDDVLEVIEAAIQTAGILKLSEAVPVLLDFAAYEAPDPTLKLAILQSLGQIADPAATSTLLTHLTSDEPVAVQEAAIQALSQIKDKAAIPTLIEKLKEGEQSEIQSAAARALGELKAHLAENALVASLQHDDAALRTAAAESLGQLNSQAASQQLRIMLETDLDDRCRQTAAEALAHTAKPSTLLALIDALGDARDFDRLQAVAAALLEREDAGLRNELIERLAEKGFYARLGHDLVTIISDEGILRQTWGAPEEQLEEPDTDPVAYFSMRLQNAEDSTHRWEAANALETFKDARATVPLMIGLFDPDPWVMLAAAQALETLREEALITEEIITERAKGLAFLKEEGVLPYLIQNLQDEMDTIQRATSWALEDAQVLCELMESNTRGDTSVIPILWNLSDKHGLKLMPDGDVIFPDGKRLSCEDAVARLHKEAG